MASEIAQTPLRPVEPERSLEQGTRLGEGITGPGSAYRSGAPTSSHAAREAILESLYQERRSWLKKQRSGTNSPGDDEYLEELTRYIDHWEAAEARPPEANEVWRKLDELAASLLNIQAKIERQPK